MSKIRHSLDLKDQLCDKCGNYLTLFRYYFERIFVFALSIWGGEFDMLADSCAAFLLLLSRSQQGYIYYQSHRNYDEVGGIFGDIAFRIAFCALLWGDTDIC